MWTAVKISKSVAFAEIIYSFRLIKELGLQYFLKPL